MKKNHLKISASIALTTVCTAALLAAEKPAEALSGFGAEYDPSNWTFTNNNADGFVNLDEAPGRISLTGGNNESGSGTTDYTITAPGSGTVSFNWDYSTNDVDGPAYDPLIRLVNETETQLSDDSGPSNSQLGSDSFPVITGDTFGFRIATTDNSAGAAFATFTDFVAPDAASATPVPFGVSPDLGILILAGMFGVSRLRNKIAARKLINSNQAA